MGGRIIGTIGWGGFSELVRLDVSKIFKIPDTMNIDFITAASFRYINFCLKK